MSLPDVRLLAAKLNELQMSGIPDLEVIAADVGALAAGKFDGLIAPNVLQSFRARA